MHICTYIHTYICWNILISQITEGKSPFFFLSMATSPVSILNIARQMEEAALFSLSRSIKYRKDGGNIGSQRSSKASPVQFPSISRFTLLLSPPPPPRRGSNIDSDISTGILFSTSLLAPFLYFSLSGGQDARHATSLPLPLRKEGHNSPSRKRSTSIYPGFSNHNLTYYLKILFENLYINYV